MSEKSNSPVAKEKRKIQIFNIPTLFTMLRLAFIPFFVTFFYLPWDWCRTVAAAIFFVAGLTDWLDGYLARYLQQTTEFGAFLDPVVDKLMVAIALVMIVGDRSLPFLVFPAIVIVGREIMISGLREWMAELGKRASLAVTMVAKLKTVIQMAALFTLLIYRESYPDWIAYLGALLLYVAAFLTLWTMLVYMKSAWKGLTEG